MQCPFVCIESSTEIISPQKYILTSENLKESDQDGRMQNQFHREKQSDNPENRLLHALTETEVYKSLVSEREGGNADGETRLEL